jgi:ribulose-5-phosphate 4-epimerase/fuculose-1-phosphate aldolase
MTSSAAAQKDDSTGDHIATANLVAEACRVLGKLDLTHFSLGHVSYRLDDDSMLIKGKGPAEVGLRYTSSRDVIRVNFDAEKVSGPPGLQPPSESFLHIWLYRTRPELKSVVHVHPETAVLLTICEKPIFPIYGAYGQGIRMAVDGVPVYPRSVRIKDDEIGADFARFMGRKNYALMRGHGVTVAGSSIEEAVVQTLILNELTSMMYKAYLLGEPKPIPDEDLAEYTRPPEADQRRGSVGGRAGVLAAYRYYRALSGEENR